MEMDGSWVMMAVGWLAMLVFIVWVVMDFGWRKGQEISKTQGPVDLWG